MLIGCIAAPRIIARAGHIRAFAAFVAIATVTTLLHPIFVDPVAWALIRAVTGFCFAGLYATIESWMHDKADNVVRGQVLALYQIVHYAGSAAGQQAIRLISPSSFVPFSIVAIALALSVLPLAYTRSDPPEPPPVAAAAARLAVPHLAGRRRRRAGLRRRERNVLVARRRCSPSAAACRAGGVASFMTAAILGAALVQWPVGRLADRSDRRHIMLVAIGIAVAAQCAMVWFAKSEPCRAHRTRGAASAPSALVLYPLSSSHAQDLGGRENAVEVSTGLLLAYTIGAIIGPTTAAWLMGWIGPQALFIHNGVIHVAFVSSSSGACGSARRRERSRASVSDDAGSGHDVRGARRLYARRDRVRAARPRRTAPC